MSTIPWQLKLQPAANSSSSHCCWELFDTPAHGRGLRATRDIAVDELIFRERSLITSPAAASATLCVICYRPLPKQNDEPTAAGCQQCGLRFCSAPAAYNDDDDEPASNCHRTHRSWECAQLSEWLPNLDRLRNDSRTYSTLLRILPAVRSLRLDDAVELRLLNAMQANGDDDDRQRSSGAFSASMLTTVFDRPPQGEMLARLRRAAAVLNTNAFETVLPADGAVRLCGLFALGGQLNHECTPNTRHSFDWSSPADDVTMSPASDVEMSVHASRPIGRGTELTTTYTRLLWDAATRRAHLWRTKQFWCRCARCERGTTNRDGVDAELAALRCRQCADGSLLPDDIDNISTSCWRCSACGARMPAERAEQTRQIAARLVAAWPLAEVGELIGAHPVVRRLVGAGSAVLVEARLRVIWSGERAVVRIRSTI